MRSQDKQREDRARAKLVTQLVAWALDIPAARITADARGARDGLARHIAYHVTRNAFGMSLSQVAAAFGRDRSTIQTGCTLIENRRDDIRFDRWIEALERAAASAPAPVLPAEGEA